MHTQRTGHPDHHPSWSINRFTYLHNCLACGYKGTLTSLLVDITGAAPEDLEITLKEQSFLRKMQEARADPATVEATANTLTEWSLANEMVDVPERLLAFRQLRRQAIDAYQVRWNRGTKQWVLPVRSPSGVLMGAQYRQTGSVLTLPAGMEKGTTLFGYSQMCQHDCCALVESPLDAVRLFGLGIPAVSSLGAWVSQDQVRLLARAFSTIYLALDDDTPGRKAASIVSPLLRRQGAAVVAWSYHGLVDEEGKKAKDVGDVADDQALLAAWAQTRRCWL
jgi:hypothetical protein